MSTAYAIYTIMPCIYAGVRPAARDLPVAVHINESPRNKVGTEDVIGPRNKFGTDDVIGNGLFLKLTAKTRTRNRLAT